MKLRDPSGRLRTVRCRGDLGSGYAWVRTGLFSREEQFGATPRAAFWALVERLLAAGWSWR